MRRLFRSVVGLAVTVATVEVAARLLAPWYSRWGSAPDEQGRAWPSDGLTPDARGVTTRAVTIHAPADDVWPWLAQIGQDRAGFYSYTLLENLVGAQMRNADRIVPEWQRREVGGIVRLGGECPWGALATQVVARLEPGRELALVAPDDWESIAAGRAARGSWAFHVVPIDEKTARLVIRSRYVHERPFFDFVHFVMERGMMLGIKQRAEHATEGQTP